MVVKIGHRGCGYEPENTLLAFKKAISLGVDMVECDVRLTKDQRLVVIHDETVDRTTNGGGKVTNLTLEQIKTLDAGKGEKVPTLEEVIDLVKGKCKLNIEIKDALTAKKVVQLVRQKKFEKETLISSNHVTVLQEIKTIKTALVYRAAKRRWILACRMSFCRLILPHVRKLILEKAKLAKTKTIHLNYFLATKKTIDYFKQRGFIVGVWTVDDQQRIKKLQELGVDNIITNFPDLIA